MIVAYIVTCMSALIYVPDTGRVDKFTFSAKTYKLRWFSNQTVKIYTKNLYSIYIPLTQCSVVEMYQQGDSE